MAEIINLNQFRKTRRRQERQETADQNRVKFGRRKQERQLNDAEREQHRRNLERHRTVPATETEDGQPES